VSGGGGSAVGGGAGGGDNSSAGGSAGGGAGGGSAGAGGMCDKEDAPNAFKVEVLLALAQLYASAPALLEETEAGGNESDAMIADGFDCVYKAREIGSDAWLPDIHAQVGCSHRLFAPVPAPAPHSL
jgi:hypothetical protein